MHGGDLPIPQDGVSRDHLLDGTEEITRHTTRRHALGKTRLPVMHSYSFFPLAELMKAKEKKERRSNVNGPAASVLMINKPSLLRPEYFLTRQ